MAKYQDQLHELTDIIAEGYLLDSRALAIIIIAAGYTKDSHETNN